MTNLLPWQSMFYRVALVGVVDNKTNFVRYQTFRDKVNCFWQVNTAYQQLWCLNLKIWQFWCWQTDETNHFTPCTHTWGDYQNFNHGLFIFSWSIIIVTYIQCCRGQTLCNSSEVTTGAASWHDSACYKAPMRKGKCLDGTNAGV